MNTDQYIEASEQGRKEYAEKVKAGTEKCEHPDYTLLGQAGCKCRVCGRLGQFNARGRIAWSTGH